MRFLYCLEVDFFFSISCTFWILFRSTSFQDTQHFLCVISVVILWNTRNSAKWRVQRQVFKEVSNFSILKHEENTEIFTICWFSGQDVKSASQSVTISANDDKPGNFWKSGD